MNGAVRSRKLLRRQDEQETLAFTDFVGPENLIHTRQLVKISDTLAAGPAKASTLFRNGWPDTKSSSAPGDGYSEFQR